MKDITIGSPRGAHCGQDRGHDWSKRARVSRFDRIEDLLLGGGAEEAEPGSEQALRANADTLP